MFYGSVEPNRRHRVLNTTTTVPFEQNKGLYRRKATYNFQMSLIVPSPYKAPWFLISRMRGDRPR